MNKIIIFIDWRQIYSRIASITGRTTHNACRPFTKYRERIQKLREKQVIQNIYIEINQTRLVLLMIQHILKVKIQQRELFQISDKVFKDRAYKIARNDEYQRALASMVYNFFDKKTGSGAIASLNEQPTKELHKPVIKKLKRGVAKKSMRDLMTIFGQQIQLK